MKKINLTSVLVFGLALWVISCAPPSAETPAEVPVVEEIEEAGEAEEVNPEPTEEPMADMPTSNMTEGCVEAYDESVDYFPNKAEVTHSEGFSVEYFNNYKVVTVLSPFAGAESGVEYVLVQCGTPAPDRFEEATVIEVPISSIIAMSTTYFPALEELGKIDTLVGVDTGLYATNANVQDFLAAGDIVEIGSGAEVNVEAAVEAEPEVIMTYSIGAPEYDSGPKLTEAGLSVVLNSDYLDTNPLGRAEWVDYIALFYNLEAESEAWFDGVVTEYNALAALVADVEEKPVVLSETPFDGTWYVPGGNSYTAQLFADAGADYPWAEDESTGSLFLDFETVFENASEADIWVNIGFFPSLSDLEAADERYAEFAAYQSGAVFNNDAITNANGGNDFFESGAIYPNVVLADLIKIFHPELLPDHEFVYYRSVE